MTIGATCTLLLAAGLTWWLTRTTRSRCEQEVRDGDRKRGLQICLASFNENGDQRELCWAAKAHMYLGNTAEADRLARSLLIGPCHGDAHGVLSHVAQQQGHPDRATMHATLALVAHTLAGDERGRMTDLFLLSGAARAAGDLRAALRFADDSLALARRLHDEHTVLVVSMQRADALRRLGDLHAAAKILTSVVARATRPCDRAWAFLKSSVCRIEAGQLALAMVDLAAATQANAACASSDISASVAMNEAWLLRSTDPQGALTRLNELSKGTGELVESLLLRGYIAADRGDLDGAERYLASAGDLVPLDADWPWVIERARGELAELRGGPRDDELAETHYRRSIARIGALRATARSHAAYFVSSHRAAYDDLIALLARQRRWRDVLAVILELDASDMLRATADESIRDEQSSASARAGSSSAYSQPPSVDEILTAWQSRDLVIVIAPAPRRIGTGHERAYRLRLAGRELTGEDVGDAAAARGWANALFANPGQRDAAQALGSMFVPNDASGGTLDVLAIGSLGKVPLAALRARNGSLIIGRRPLARVLALRARGPDATGGGPPVVVANPTGDLDSAEQEGAVVLKALGAGVIVLGAGHGVPATRSRFFASRTADLLHVAGHVSVLGRWRTLNLADGDVDPAELVQHRFAPRVAVLAGCGSAAATDEEGWGSIAAALLESGTTVVIATDRSVEDPAARTLIGEFYAQSDWRTDPTHALASVQIALDARAQGSADKATMPQHWAAFSVLRRPPVIDERRP